MSLADKALGALAALPITTVTREDVAAWVNGLADASLAGKTIRNRHGLVPAAFDSAVQGGKIIDNPFKRTRIPRTDHATTEMDGVP